MEPKPKSRPRREDYELVQIVPALPGWRAWYKCEDGKPPVREDGEPVLDTIACWALADYQIRDAETNKPIGKPERRMVGLVWAEFAFEPAEETGNFGGYVGPGEAIPKRE